MFPRRGRKTEALNRLPPARLRLSRNDRGDDGHDSRALQHYPGHKSIAHTVRYTELAPDRFKTFWRD